jgi:uncharacterized membrane protein YfcA
MNAAELTEIGYSSLAICIALYGIFFTLLFAYVVAMYLAGSQLTHAQYTIVNTLYLLTMATVVLGTHEAWASAHLWWADAWEEPTPLWDKLRLWFNTVTMMVSVFLGMWFGRKVRHPESG